MAATALGYTPIAVSGSSDQRAAYGGRLAKGEMAAFCLTEPEAGSNVADIRTIARRDGDGFVIEGSKTFISGASVADFFTVFAKTDADKGHRGMTAFIVDRAWQGVSVGVPFEKMGQRASDTAPVIFEGVRVPSSHVLGEVGSGFAIAMKTLDRSRATTAASAVGLAKRAFDEAAEYARTRKTMGTVIGKHQAIGHLLAEMAIDIEAARLLTWNAALAAEHVGPNVAASYAKAFAGDAVMRVTTNAVQIFGGYGYMVDYPVEKLMRDAKIYQIYEGTSQIQREIIARTIVGR
jgi:acyl-CoA dehydrogenase